MRKAPQALVYTTLLWPLSLPPGAPSGTSHGSLAFLGAEGLFLVMHSAASPRCGLLIAVALLAGCEGAQSAFTPFGTEAESARQLTLGMAIAAALITTAVLLLARHALRAPADSLDHRGGMRLILWLGAIVPTVALAVLLILSLPGMRSIATQPTDLRIAVDGEQFWWRVTYRPAGAPTVETANEIRVPVGRTVVFDVGSPDVIHSFWIPGLAGKMDMIPGRRNELVVRATRAGRFRGQCTEFCGLSHALMAFDVIAMAPADFDAWLAGAARPARPVETRGRRLFEEFGCSGCHVIRGHVTGTPIGPDLTHVGSRRTLGAGALPMSEAALGRFIRNPAHVKPGALMPAFGSMPENEAAAIASYLAELR